MLFDLLKTSFRSLMSNKTRTFLTMLGIIIGVFAVISLISIGQGIQNYVTGQFGKLGSNLIFVTPGKLNLRGDPGANFNSNKLDEKHLRLIENYASDYVINVTPILEIGKTVSYKNKTYYTELQATNELGYITYSVEIESGKYFSRSDVNSNSRVAILGATAALELFPNQDPIGKNIKVDDKSFEVIGLAKEKGSSLDRRVFIPYTTAKHVFNIEKFSAIVMTSKSNENVDSAMKRVEIAILRDLKEDQFTVISQKDLLSSFQSILSTITIGIGAIAAISLLVGGIGIMNIMLVTERTSEIGLRKAVGATPNNIAMQFLVEAMSLSVLGGLIGMSLGILLALVVRTYFNFDAEVPSWSIFLAFGFSVLIGVIFGTYPAIKAAKKDPIEALRYE